MVAQNSSHCIGKALESVRDICDEIIVVDGGSSDDTIEIAKSFEKVKILNCPWSGNFALQKNCAIDQATGDWIFILDTDETIGPLLRDKIRRLIRSNKYDCYIFPRYWVAKMQPLSYIHSKKLYPDYQQRLFRNLPRFRYVVSRKVHEKFPDGTQGSGKKIKNTHILHFDFIYNDRSAREKKVEERTSLAPETEHISRMAYLFEDYPHKVCKCREKLW
jgi:glycosyltransferase involved in cell wall biosynthesis